MPYKTPELRRADYLTNKERDLAANRVWKSENSNHRHEVDKSWRERNKEHRKAVRRIWYESNKKRQLELNAAWKAANPDLRRTYKMTRRARKLGAFVESVNTRTVFERDDGVCQICHLPIGEATFHIDHVIPLCKGGEHSYANVQLSHARCNLSKGSNG